MLATAGGAPLESGELAYEPKYDGIRALAEIDGRVVRLWSRLGNDKTAQFAEVADALGRLGTATGRPLLLDGEIVALDAAGEPASFLDLQPRMHARRPPPVPVTFIAFDVLRDGRDDLRPRPLEDRRRHLEALLDGATGPALRVSEHVVGSGEALWARAQRSGWDGLIAKRRRSPYASGRRSTA